MPWHQHLVDHIAWHGGTARRHELRVFTKRQLAEAVRLGVAVRDAPGRYSLPDADRDLRMARRLCGARSHRSAALAHGWGVATRPQRPELVVPRGRRVSSSDQRGSDVHWRDLSAREVRLGVTSPLRTVLDCCRDLPFEEALPVADSALRARAVTAEELTAAAERCRTKGAAAVRRVARHATAKAANPFESRLRAICAGLCGLAVEPQVGIGRPGFAAVVAQREHASVQRRPAWRSSVLAVGEPAILSA